MCISRDFRHQVSALYNAVRQTDGTVRPSLRQRYLTIGRSREELVGARLFFGSISFSNGKRFRDCYFVRATSFEVEKLPSLLQFHALRGKARRSHSESPRSQCDRNIAGILIVCSDR
jgi:hypothetical protein